MTLPRKEQKYSFPPSFLPHLLLWLIVGNAKLLEILFQVFQIFSTVLVINLCYCFFAHILFIIWSWPQYEP